MPEVEVQPAPELIVELADACVRFVQEALKLPLDYTTETLPILDHYAKATATAQHARDEVRDLLTPALGAYFGEVVRRALPGVRWHIPESRQDFFSYRLEFESIFLHFNPLGIAREVLEQEEVEGSGSNFQVLDEARGMVIAVLEQNGEVSAEDYYTFSVRAETLELVISVLAELEHQHQGPPRVFGPEVYRAASGESVGRGVSS